MSCRIAYIDSSDLTHAALERLWPDHAGQMKVYVGDMKADALPEFCAGCDTVWNGHTMMDGALMDRMSDLRRILFLGSGPASYIDMEAARTRGISVERITGYGDRAVAEHALGLMLAAMRNLSRMDRDLRRGRWEPMEGMELAGKRLGLIGFGGIGCSFAGLARALGMEVSVWNRSPLTGAWADAQTDLDHLLESSDVVSLHLALTPDTRGLLSASRFARLRQGAILVNTARADLVDTQAMIAALEEGRLGHAALDVFDHEPLPADAPLLDAPNVTLSAHAGFKTAEAVERMIGAAVEMTRAPG